MQNHGRSQRAEIFSDPSYSNTNKAVANKTKKLTTTDPKTMKMAEALRFELNNYGPTSSDDSIDRQVVEVLHIQSVKGDHDMSYKIKVKFKTGIFFEGTDEVIYESIIWEDSKGQITVGKYDSVDA